MLVLKKKFMHIILLLGLSVLTSTSHAAASDAKYTGKQLLTVGIGAFAVALVAGVGGYHLLGGELIVDGSVTTTGSIWAAMTKGTLHVRIKGHLTIFQDGSTWRVMPQVKKDDASKQDQ